ncbi:MAG TPA: His/Gly/Thr/Pro-type tRNA ligase C-terminal domain-containing protein, partial [Candidatus Saccharimonadales bacterium]|nr:His/Gly/Thr/Pro-type tRNA ligase C-terminal domain-containing protein [Candidatus Saccharimonadales bacterium]
DVREGAMHLADSLREEGVNTEVDFTGRKLDKQIKTAIKKEIPFMVFVGEEELKQEIYPFKDVAKAEEQKLSFERIISTVKDRRLKHDDDLDDLFE